MENPITLVPVEADSADLKAAVNGCIVEIDLVREHIERDQNEIDRLKAETREILARLKVA